MDANQPDPPYGVRGQLNSRFEQHTIGYLRRAPMRHWVVAEVREHPDLPGLVSVRSVKR